MQIVERETHSVDGTLQILSSTISQENQQKRTAKNMNISFMV